MKNLQVVIAKIYSLIPGDLKIVIYPAFLTFIIAELLASADKLKEILLYAGPFAAPIVIFVLTLLSGVVGYLGKKIATKGQVVLVQQGDTSTITQLQDKVAQTQAVLNKAP